VIIFINGKLHHTYWVVEKSSHQLNQLLIDFENISMSYKQ